MGGIGEYGVETHSVGEDDVGTNCIRVDGVRGGTGGCVVGDVGVGMTGAS